MDKNVLLLKLFTKMHKPKAIYTDIKSYSHILVRKKRNRPMAPNPINKKRSADEFEPLNKIAMSKRHKFAERSINEFELLNKIGEGAYGVVYKARDKQTREIVAVKKVKSADDKESPETSILTRLNHRSIVNLKHAISSGGSDFLVMEYAENDVRSLLKTMKQAFSQSEVKCLMQQLLLQGVDYLHRNQVMHRDL